MVSATGERAGQELTVSDGELPGVVAQREEAAARGRFLPQLLVWTWQDTSAPAVLLCAAGVWVTWCRDLDRAPPSWPWSTARARARPTTPGNP
ncbi:hypothetical protein QJS66_18665 [Kocuria rhizophila]|nr:hypothetical protein QJS66_18665 [Kocuria rhizophila]